MTARELVSQWFARPQSGVASNLRFVTVAQIDLLRKLLEEEPLQDGELHPGRGRSFAWLPAGLWRYVVTEGDGGRRNTIMMFPNVEQIASGRLFG